MCTKFEKQNCNSSRDSQYIYIAFAIEAHSRSHAKQKVSKLSQNEMKCLNIAKIVSKMSHTRHKIVSRFSHCLFIILLKLSQNYI